jgi:hypothetical protein
MPVAQPGGGKWTIQLPISFGDLRIEILFVRIVHLFLN